MRRFLALLAAIGLLAAPVAVHAGVILQDSFDSTFQVNAFEPMAQSFTAEDSAVKFAFYYAEMNPSFPNDPLELRLLLGDGLAGAQLSSVTFSLAAGFEGFFDIDFSSVALIVGTQYTAVLSVPGTSPYWGIQIALDGNPYAGGRAYFSGSSPVNDADDDMRFRVTPIGGAVAPAPATLALLGLGLIGLGFSRRKRAI